MAAPKQRSYILSPKTTTNLMQNCDLPPPTKLVPGPDWTTLMPSISKIYDKGHTKMHEDDKLEILKALQQSQTRATEAERKLRMLSEFKEALSGMLVDESMILFAHRQWVNLLEIRVFKLERERREEEREREDCGMNWCGAIALCLAIAGVGIAFSSRYTF